MARAWRIASLLIGLSALVLFVKQAGVQPIASAVSRAGWILLVLLPLHAVPLILDVFGWRELLAGLCPQRTPKLASLFGMAAVREAVNRLLPVANVGGEVVGMRLLVVRGVPLAPATASIVVEVLLTIVAQFVFFAFGIVAVLQVTGETNLVRSLTLLLLVGLPVLAALAVVLGFGSVSERVGRVVEPLIGPRIRAALGAYDPGQLDTQIRRLYRAHGRLARALVWQVAGLCAGVIETWCVLRWIGSPASVPAALAFESVTQVVRHFVFFVPGALGVQEAGLLALGYALGVGNDAVLALSIVKRIRELLFGGAALLAWHWWEGRSLVRGVADAVSRTRR